jgi:hypothetical protein
LIYPCFEAKRLSEPEPHFQLELEESRGILLRVYPKDGFCIAVYNFGAVALPLEIETRLRELVGKKIAVIRLDGQYRIRVLDGNGHV